MEKKVFGLSNIFSVEIENRLHNGWFMKKVKELNKNPAVGVT